MIKSLKLFSTPIFPIFLIVIFTLVDQPFFVYSLPSTIDSGFKIEKVYSASFKPSTMVGMKEKYFEF